MLRLGVMAGHGGTNRGTTQNGVDEADFCLAFARQFMDKVHAAWPTMGATMLRTEDRKVSLTEGAEIAKDAGCNLVFIFHVNAGAPTLSGGLLMHLDDDATAMRVARVVHRAYPLQLAPMTREPLSVDRYVADSDWRSNARNVMSPYRDRLMSPVLVELFYASNETDVKIVKSPWTREQLCMACLSGIAEANRGAV